ncbi:hypothetical protein HHI36_016690, partial [Cryptolaemus montrouzieri]
MKALLHGSKVAEMDLKVMYAVLNRILLGTMLKGKVRARNVAPVAFQQLKDVIQEEWDNISQDVSHYIEST